MICNKTCQSKFSWTFSDGLAQSTRVDAAAKSKIAQMQREGFFGRVRCYQGFREFDI